MKRFHKKWLEKGLMIRISVLFLFGFFAGILFYFGLSKGKIETDSEQNKQYLDKLQSQEISFDLFFYVTWQKIKEILLFFCFSLTWLWQPAICFILLRSGFLLGYLWKISFLLFEQKGWLLIIGYYFPQVLIRVPMWLLCFLTVWELWKKTGSYMMPERPEQPIRLHKNILLHIDLKRIIVILSLCILEGAAEATAGTLLFKKIISVLMGE